MLASFGAQLVAAVVSALLAVALLCALAALALHRQSSNRTLMWGTLKPPGVSPDTTLLITDIYNR